MDKSEYLSRYKARLIERGLEEPFAQKTIDAIPDCDIDLDDSPEDAADDELSNWGD